MRLCRYYWVYVRDVLHIVSNANNKLALCIKGLINIFDIVRYWFSYVPVFFKKEKNP